MASGTTPVSRPTRNRTDTTAALPVRSVTASTTLWVIESSCIALPPLGAGTLRPPGDRGQEVRAPAGRGPGERPIATTDNSGRPPEGERPGQKGGAEGT